MQKIPTVFRRDPDDLSRVLPEVDPRCQWVFEGEGVATRKHDGTCMQLDNDGRWWSRREVKPGKAAPAGFVAVDTDPETGKTQGWEPIEQSTFVKAFHDADRAGLSPGTYELVGPKVQGNPEGYDVHHLVRHLDAEAFRGASAPERTFDALMDWLLRHDGDIEGIVWHHSDGRMAKLKVRDAKRTVGARR